METLFIKLLLGSLISVLSLLFLCGLLYWISSLALDHVEKKGVTETYKNLMIVSNALEICAVIIGVITSALLSVSFICAIIKLITIIF